MCIRPIKTAANEYYWQVWLSDFYFECEYTGVQRSNRKDCEYCDAEDLLLGCLFGETNPPNILVCEEYVHMYVVKMCGSFVE